MRRLGRISLAVVILLAILLFAAGGLVYYKREMDRRWKWEPIPMREALARVPEPWTEAKLAERLHATGKIRDVETFDEAAGEVGLTHVAEGGYALPATAGPLELAKIFVAGPTHQKVTFPEGFTAIQVAARLKAHGFSGSGQLLQLAYPAKTASPLEGRLFPDTYLLPLKATGKQLATRLQERYLNVTDSLARPFPVVNGKRLSLSEVVVLASLLEREAASSEEMPLVAGVLVNRLNKGMRLQVDATVQYARVLAEQEGVSGEGHKAVLTYQDLKIDSPYNTYLHAGLPPAPICNPGASALLAAAHPRQSDYLFYVMSPLLKRHRFGKTFAEHEHNISLAKLERAATAQP